jgi:phosphoglycerate dehydrogenase-like enzyme
MKPRVRAIVLDAAGPGYADGLAAAFPEVGFHVCTDYADLEPAIAAHAPEVALVFRVGTAPFPRDRLVESGPFRWIQTSAAGIDHIRPWDPARVTVTNGSGVYSEAIAQYVLGAVLAFNQRFPLYARQQAQRLWRKHENRSITGQTLTVVGFGDIGRATGDLARRAGMRVIGVRARPQDAPPGITVVGSDGLTDAVAVADHVAVCLPLTTATRGMVGAAAFAAMRPGAHLVDVSRGGVVDEAVLLAALRDGRLAHATLDVFAREPLPAESPFWDLPNVTLTPHSSGDAEGWRTRVVDLFAGNLRLFLDGRPLRNVVDPVRGY